MTEYKKSNPESPEYTQRLTSDEELNMLSAQSDVASLLVPMARFSFNVRTREFCGNKLFSEFCPLHDGRILPLEEWIHPDDLQKLRQKVDELLAGKINSFLLEYRTDYFGSLRTYRGATTLVVNGEGDKILNGAVLEVTGDISIPPQNKVSQSFLEQSMDTVPVIFYIKDTNLRYIFVNRYFLAFTDKRFEDVVGRTDMEIDPSWGLCQGKDEQTLHCKVTSFFENRTHSKTGEIRFFHTLKWQDIDANGHRILLGISIDVTDRYLLFDDLRLANECMSAFFSFEDDTVKLRHIMELITRHLNASHCIVSTFDETKGIAKCIQEYVVPGKGNYLFLNSRGIRFSTDDAWYRCLVKNKILDIQNPKAPEATKILGQIAPLLRNLNIKRICAIPFYDKSRMDGSISFLFPDEPNEFSPERISHLMIFAGHLIHSIRFLAKQRSKVNNTFKQLQHSELAKQVAISDEKVIRDCLEIMLKEGDLVSAGRKSLQRTFEHLVAEHGFYFIFHPDRKTVELRIEYSKDNKPILTEGKEYPYTKQEPFELLFRQTPFIMIPELRKHALFTDDSSPWKNLITEHHLTSLYAYQVKKESGVIGFFAVVYANNVRLLTDANLGFVRSIAHCFELLMERQQTNDSLEAALVEAQSANKAKNFFIASVSHELRTPLNSIVAFADIMKDHTVSENELREYLENVNYWGNVLTRFFDDLLDLVQADSGTMVLLPKPTDFKSLCDETFDDFCHYAKNKGIEIDLKFEWMPRLMLDRKRIHQILFTTLDNALKYTEHGRVLVSCSFVPDPNGIEGTLTFIVSDTGIGISKEDRVKLMEPFTRLSTLRGIHSTNCGTGLGISLAKRMIHLMNGTFDLKSELGKGTEVRMTLNHVAIVQPNSKPDNQDFVISKTSISELTVLLVDDVPINLQVLKAVCERIGIHDLVAVLSGELALNELKQRPFDLVLTDMRMPEMTGEELVQAMRAEKSLSRIPAIAVTADVNSNDNYDMSMFSDIVFKPVTKKKILQSIMALMHSKDEK